MRIYRSSCSRVALPKVREDDRLKKESKIYCTRERSHQDRLTGIADGAIEDGARSRESGGSGEARVSIAVEATVVASRLCVAAE